MQRFVDAEIGVLINGGKDWYTINKKELQL
jgi:hypothetical protein